MSDYKKCIDNAKNSIAWARHFRFKGDRAHAAWNLEQAAFWRCEAEMWSGL